MGGVREGIRKIAAAIRVASLKIGYNTCYGNAISKEGTQEKIG